MDTYKVTNVLNVVSRLTKHHGNNHIPFLLSIFGMTTFDLLHLLEMFPTSLKSCSITRKNVGYSTILFVTTCDYVSFVTAFVTTY